MTSPESQANFAEALRMGNHQSAGEYLVRSFASEVFGLCFAIVQNAALAEDLSQEVFAKAFGALGGFRGEASARTWILKIARNRCVDHLRGQRRWSAFDDDGDPDEVPEEISLPNTILSRRADVARALLGLDEVERALIVLRFRHGLDYQELAAAFGLKIGTTRMRVSRALAKMRELLEEPTTTAPSQAAPAPQSAPARRAPAPSAPRMAPPPPSASVPPPVRSSTPPPSAPSRSRISPARPPGAMPPLGAPSMSPLGATALGGGRQHVLNLYFESVHAPLSSTLQQRLSGMTASLPEG